MLIAYIHGFLSGPNALKSRLLRDFLKKSHPDIRFTAPDFPDTPREAEQTLEEFCRSCEGDRLCLVGSSMGGFFSTLLSRRHGLKAALLNPCCHPQDFLSSYTGESYNPETGRRFEIKPEMWHFLAELDQTLEGFDRSLIKVYLQSGDEVLDYRRSLDFYKGCRMQVTEGGCHTFENFEQIIPDILEFFLEDGDKKQG